MGDDSSIFQSTISKLNTSKKGKPNKAHQASFDILRQMYIATFFDMMICEINENDGGLYLTKTIQKIKNPYVLRLLYSFSKNWPNDIREYLEDSHGNSKQNPFDEEFDEILQSGIQTNCPHIYPNHTPLEVFLMFYTTYLITLRDNENICIPKDLCDTENGVDNSRSIEFITNGHPWKKDPRHFFSNHPSDSDPLPDVEYSLGRFMESIVKGDPKSYVYIFFENMVKDLYSSIGMLMNQEGVGNDDESLSSDDRSESLSSDDRTNTLEKEDAELLTSPIPQEQNSKDRKKRKKSPPKQTSKSATTKKAKTKATSSASHKSQTSEKSTTSYSTSMKWKIPDIQRYWQNSTSGDNKNTEDNVSEGKKTTRSSSRLLPMNKRKFTHDTLRFDHKYSFGDNILQTYICLLEKKNKNKDGLSIEEIALFYAITDEIESSMENVTMNRDKYRILLEKRFEKEVVKDCIEIFDDDNDEDGNKDD